ncbi:MAG: hypothetical protein JWO15_3575 [Sphingomonadales bacterium]|nr:hypothetical protein [Sphingomonadales bacterium]
MTSHTTAIMINEDTHSITLVPDAVAIGKSVGLQVHWRLAGTVEKDVFNAALSKVLPDHLLPGNSKDGKYLKRALETIRESRSANLVRKVGGDKFSIVHETRDLLDLDLIGEHDPAYSVTLNADLVNNPDGSQSIKVTPEDHPQAKAIKEEFERQRMLYHSGTDLSQWLTIKIINHVNGVSGRDRGGFYFIPAGEDTARFQEIMEVLHAVSTFDSSGRLLAGIKIYAIPAVLSDNMAEAVVDSITDECEQMAAEINEKINEASLTTRGWNGQRKVIIEMSNKISKFGNLLGVGFDNLLSKINELENGIGYLEAKMASEDEASAA